MHLQDLAERIVPILAFVLCLTVVAELADRFGVFAVLADRVAALAGGVVWRLWVLVVVLAVLSTTVLSLDTTAVLLTPVVLALASQLRLDLALFAYTAVWLANTASLGLPVSNLTNLLSVSVLRLDGPGFARLMWPAAVASLLVTVAALALIFRRSLRGRYVRVPPTDERDRVLLGVGIGVCALLGPAFALGVNVTLAAATAALVLVIVSAWRAPELLTPRLLPWPLLLGVSVLFLGVQIAHEHGLASLLGALAGRTGTGFADLLRLTAVAALGANVVDNLPSYLAMEPVASGSPDRLAALLVGVNAGPLITPWASLATLLWAARCRAAGVDVNWRTFALRGVVVVPVLLAAGVGALVLVHG